MANPTNLEGFTFSAFYDYTNDDPADPNATWVTAQYATGDGQAGYQTAQDWYDQAQQMIAGGANYVRNIVIRYISIPQWTDWEQDSGTT